MKTKITITLLAIFLLSLNLFAGTDEPDSMYIHFTATDNSDSIVAHAIADVDSIVYYAPEVIEPTSGTFTDSRDNITYKRVKIGTQVWMSENLRATQYTDGTAIPNVDDRTQDGSNGADNTTWADLEDNDTDKAYCWYNNDSTNNAAIYGALYTYAAALNACPAGWHLPSDAEWKTLEMALGMSQYDADNTGWRGTNEGSQLAGNSDLWDTGNLENDSKFETSGFLALPGGNRSSSNGTFDYRGGSAYWWSSTQSNSSSAYHRRLTYLSSTVTRSYFNKSHGFSVRCVRD